MYSFCCKMMNRMFGARATSAWTGCGESSIIKNPGSEVRRQDSTRIARCSAVFSIRIAVNGIAVVPCYAGKRCMSSSTLQVCALPVTRRLCYEIMDSAESCRVARRCPRVRRGCFEFPFHSSTTLNPSAIRRRRLQGVDSFLIADLIKTKAARHQLLGAVNTVVRTQECRASAILHANLQQ